MNNPKVSIIILNWNGLKDTIGCLDSLKKITYPNYDVIVVNNGSKGNDADVLEEKYKDYIKLIRNKENLGFTGGNNVGIDFVLKEKIAPDYIFLLNNDVKIQKNCLTNLVNAFLQTDAGIIGAGTKDENRTDNKIYFGGHPMTKFSLIREFFPRAPLMLPETDAILECNCVSGAAMLIKKEVLLDIYNSIGRYLNDKIFMYYDELDFCVAARKLGHKSIIAQNAIIYHKGSSSTGGIYNPLAYYYSVRNYIILSRNFFPFPIRHVIFIYNFIFNFIRAVKNTMHGRFYSSWAIFCGLYDGYTGTTGKWKYHDVISAKRRKEYLLNQKNL